MKMALLVASLGYFVDVYDIVLFTAIREPSLVGLGFAGPDLFRYGTLLLNSQMLGMLIGGVLWGVAGDRRGRKSVLFGSILLYSLANLLNSQVSNIPSYIILRFMSGVGLAGELGAGVTLISEMMSRTHRSYGTAIIAFSGAMGGTLAGLLGGLVSWRTSFLIGGSMGLFLLFLRFQVKDSSLFQKMTEGGKKGGDLSVFIKNPKLLKTFFRCLLVGVPIWVVIGFFVTFAPEIARQIGTSTPVTGARALLFFNFAFGLGDFFSGLVSHKLKSRKLTIYIFLAITTFAAALYLFEQSSSVELFYAKCFLLGLGTGYWSLFLMISAENFGTAIRATSATILPNLVRAMVVPISALLAPLKNYVGLIPTLSVFIFLTLGLAFYSTTQLRETFDHDLDFY